MGRASIRHSPASSRYSIEMTSKYLATRERLSAEDRAILFRIEKAFADQFDYGLEYDTDQLIRRNSQFVMTFPEGRLFLFTKDNAEIFILNFKLLLDDGGDSGESEFVPPLISSRHREGIMAAHAVALVNGILVLTVVVQIILTIIWTY